MPGRRAGDPPPASTETRPRRMRALAFATLLTATLPVVALSACKDTTRPDGGSGPLAVGAEVPALSAPDHRGETVDLRNMPGSFVVYFYPRDGTPGCTKEACAFRDAWSRYEAAEVAVVGVSTDSVESHREFAETHQLPFALVSDVSQSWASAFGVATRLGMSERISFLVGPQGRIAKVYPGVDPGVHASEVLEDAAVLTRADTH